MTGGATAGSGRAFRLDPHSLPARFSAEIGGKAPEAAIVLDRDTALVRRQMRAGPPITFTIPVRSYSGVAVRMEPVGTDGEIRVTLELLHQEEGFCLPLLSSDNPEDVALDWQAWGHALNLPLLIVGADGRIDAPLEETGPLKVARAKPRRRHSFFKGRRSRFLRRRKPGAIGRTELLAGREIIARN